MTNDEMLKATSGSGIGEKDEESQTVNASLSNDLLCCCDYCNNGDGESIYPYYGLAPHKHDMTKTGGIIGSTVIDGKDAWPDNFCEDPEAEGCGTYCYCPKCGRPGNEELHYKDIKTRKMRNET